VSWENRLTFRISSADPGSDTPVWFDFTTRVRDVVQVLEWGVGRTDDVDATEPGTLTILLDNRDDALTYGNTTSPYAAWWGPGRRCQLIETIGATSIVQVDAFLLMPEEQLATAGVEQYVSMTVVDVLGWLENAERFVSTLGAHVVGSSATAGTPLVYWPFNDEGRSFLPAIGAEKASAFAPKLGAVLAPASTAGPAGDDESYLAISGTPVGDTTLVSFGLAGLLEAPLTGVTISGAGQTLALSAWVRISSDGATYGVFTFASADFLDTIGLYLGTGGTVVARFVHLGNAYEASYAGGLGVEVWQLVTVRYSITGAALTLWIGGQIVATTTVGGPAISSITLLKASLGDQGRTDPGTGGAHMSIGHLQLYIGADPTTMPYVAHLAQLDVGLNGLERQTTGNRISTILRYAGITGGAGIDVGQSVMQRASLAGQTPAEALSAAARTEQGLLWVRNGAVTFYDRRTLYNI
jgi:hypothetical protein